MTWDENFFVFKNPRGKQTHQVLRRKQTRDRIFRSSSSLMKLSTKRNEARLARLAIWSYKKKIILNMYQITREKRKI